MRSIPIQWASLFTTAAEMGCGHLFITTCISHITVSLGQLTLRTLLGTQDNPNAPTSFQDQKKLVPELINPVICHFCSTLGYKRIIPCPQLSLSPLPFTGLLRGFFKFISQDRVDSHTYLGVLPHSQSLSGKVKPDVLCSVIPKCIWTFCCETFSLLHPRKGAWYRVFPSRTHHHLSSPLFSQLPLFS